MRFPRMSNGLFTHIGEAYRKTTGANFDVGVCQKSRRNEPSVCDPSWSLPMDLISDSDQGCTRCDAKALQKGSDAILVGSCDQKNVPKSPPSSESQSKPGTKMVYPEPCKELRRRISAASYGWEYPLLTSIYSGFDCDSSGL